MDSIRPEKFAHDVIEGAPIVADAVRVGIKEGLVVHDIRIYLSYNIKNQPL